VRLASKVSLAPTHTLLTARMEEITVATTADRISVVS